MMSTVYRNIKKRGAGMGTGGVYRGRRTQRGHGVGSAIAKVFKAGIKLVKPLAKGGAKAVGNAASKVGKKVVTDALKQGAKQAATYAKDNKGNIAKSLIGTAGASVIGAVGERIGNKKKGEEKKKTKQVKEAVKQAKKADTQIKQGIKRKAEAIEKIENAVTATQPPPPAKRK